MSERKRRLLASKTQLVGSVTVDVDGKPETFDVRNTSVGAKASMQEKARAAGELDANDKPTSARANLLMGARLVVATVYEPGTLTAMFDESDIPELIDTTFFSELIQQVGELLGPGGAKGKSTAAASTQPESPSPAPSIASPTR